MAMQLLLRRLLALGTAGVTLIPVVLSSACKTSTSSTAAAGSDLATKPSFDSVKRFIIIGDSLSDQQNQWQNKASFYVPEPQLGYWNGRFTNGYNWVDYLIQENPSLGHRLVNAAVGGAEILRPVLSTMIANDYNQQIDLLLLQAPLHDASHEGADSVVVIWGGANDILTRNQQRPEGNGAADGKALGEQLGQSVQGMIEKFKSHGVKQFLIAELPNIGHTPMVTGVGQLWHDSADKQAYAIAAVQAYNGFINKADFNNDRDHTTIIIVPVQSFLEDGINQKFATPNANMSIVTDPCIPHMTGDRIAGVLFGGSYVRKDCPNNLFFDRLHPSSHAHCLLTGLFEDALRKSYDDVKGLVGQDRVVDCAAKQDSGAIFDDNNTKEPWDNGISWH